jgi:hypothetical protein
VGRLYDAHFLSNASICIIMNYKLITIKFSDTFWNTCRFWEVNRKLRNHYEDLDVNERTILEKEDGDMKWIHLAQNKGHGGLL